MAENYTKETTYKTSNITPESWMIELWQWADEYDIPNRTLPRNAEELLNIQSLSLRWFDITQLPRSLFELSNLKELTVRSDSLIQLPNDIEKLQNLETLEIISNQLTCISHRIGQLSCLETLWLRCPNLEHLPSSIEQLTSLTELGVESQKISNLLLELPENLKQRYRDKKLSLYRSLYCSFYTPSLNYDYKVTNASIDISDDWNEEKLSALKYQTDADIIIALQTSNHIKPIMSSHNIDCIIHCDTRDIAAIKALFNYDFSTGLFGLDFNDLRGFLIHKQGYYISSDAAIDPSISGVDRAQQSVDQIIARLPTNAEAIWVHVVYANETTYVEADEIEEALNNRVRSDIRDRSVINTYTNAFGKSDYYTIKAICVVG